ncbi:hypothetical protein HETIRDRAFT_65769 [Heterobasidion irregulare TC 32-1]|uniref:Glycoside hydrolase family 105 protein n=1 Tax=Heterobasidion irregulare (strain TC 32-1) TaxID=747525 RepID=W4JU05_HETIT|nr:uncharacterized protein HETIRDRAFT_65769 [Heterobasidion irregulare TC 32-1]ETW76346.1 hypothetical protein HETIRDRAFT_65769 [Heterobasidion irregulare TC 32-1]
MLNVLGVGRGATGFSPFPLLLLLFLGWAFTAPAHAQTLTDDQVSAVKQRLAEGATHSWEFGTRAQTLLELDAPPFSVLSPDSLPPPRALNASANASLADVLSIAQNIVSGRAKSNGNATGPQPLIADGSAADPASIGVAVLLANWTGLGRVDGLDYAGAARDELDFLFNDVPKTSDGAFSHRVSQVQLWSDFVYMVPPFLAYYGVLSQNQTLLGEAYTQIKLYRNYLIDNSAGGLWKHVLLGDSGNDEGHWSTGNAWAAAGMLRVLGTMKNSPYSKSFKNQISDLGQWAFDIQKAMYPHLQSNNLFKNYADSTDSTNFDDAASTALLAATVYRLSLLTGTHTYLPFAERCRTALFSTNAASATPSAFAATAAHFSSDGWLAPVVNPDAYGVQGANSPEGEAFVLQLHSAWRDWVADGARGANGASRPLPTYGTFAMVVASVWTAATGW